MSCHGPGFWKFNVSLLKEASLVEGVEALWNVLKGSQIKNGIWWENCKFTFKRFLLSYSRKKAYQDKKQTRVLLAQIGLFEELAVEDPPFFAAILSDLKASLNSLTEMKARGAQVRSRSVYLDTEEKPCSYFLRRESARSKDKFIFELCDDSGRLYRDPLSLQRVCRNFYKELLSESPVDDDSIDDLLGAVPTLGGDARLSCEGPLSYEEGLKAVRGMKRDKSPGLDGLPAEFYKRFFYLFGRDFVSMVNGCLVQGELPLSLRTGLITLIPKDDSKKSFLKYWRPISLLNVDYKIISKALSNRLAGVLHYVISEGVRPVQSRGGRSVITYIWFGGSLTFWGAETSPVGWSILTKRKPLTVFLTGICFGRCRRSVLVPLSFHGSSSCIPMFSLQFWSTVS